MTWVETAQQVLSPEHRAAFLKNRQQYRELCKKIAADRRKVEATERH